MLSPLDGTPQCCNTQASLWCRSSVYLSTLFGNRVSLSRQIPHPTVLRSSTDNLIQWLSAAVGVFVAMVLVNWATTTQGTAAAFGIYAFAYTFGPTVIIDSIRTSMWHQSVFGSAYAIKIVINNSYVLSPAVCLCISSLANVLQYEHYRQHRNWCHPGP